MAKATTTTTTKTPRARKSDPKSAAAAKDNGASGDNGAATDEKSKRARKPFVEGTRGSLVRALSNVKKLQDRIATSVTDDEDHKAILSVTEQELTIAIEKIEEAMSVFSELPEDFKPSATRRGVSTFEAGNVVILRESKHALYVGLFDDLCAELTVASLVGSKRVLCTTADGARAVFPIAHVKSV